MNIMLMDDLIIITGKLLLMLTKMREAGFEPAHPEIVGLKSTALDHSAIRAKYWVLVAGLEPATLGS
jgi:hypothetical protein